MGCRFCHQSDDSDLSFISVYPVQVLILSSFNKIISNCLLISHHLLARTTNKVGCIQRLFSWFTNYTVSFYISTSIYVDEKVMTEKTNTSLALREQETTLVSSFGLIMVLEEAVQQEQV